MPGCCAYGCRNRSGEEKKLFSIPRSSQDQARRTEWLRRINRANFNPSRRSVLCEDHFTDDQFEPLVLERYGVKKLRRDAVPTIFCYDKSAKTSSVKVLAKKRIRTTKNSCFYRPRLKKKAPLETLQESQSQPGESVVHINVDDGVLQPQEALPASVESSSKDWLSSSSNQCLAPTRCQQAARPDKTQLVQGKNVAAVSLPNKDCAGVEMGDQQGVAGKTGACSSSLVHVTTVCSSTANGRQTAGAIESYSFPAWPSENTERATAVGGHDHEATPVTPGGGAPEVFVTCLIPAGIENGTRQEGRDECASSSALCQSSACSNVQSKPQHDTGQEDAPARLPLPSGNDTVKDGNRQRSAAVKATVVAASTIIAGLRPIRPKQALAGDIQKALGSTGAGTVNWLGSRTVQKQAAVETSADSSTVQRLVRAGLGGGQQCEAAQAKNLRMPRDCVDGHQTSMQNLADDTGCIETDGHRQSLFSGSVGDVNVCQSETGAAGPSSLPSSIKISSVYTLAGDAASAEERGQELINAPTVNLQGGVATGSARLTVGSQEAGEEPIHATDFQRSDNPLSSLEHVVDVNAAALARMLDRRPLTSEEDLWDRIDDLEEKLLHAQKRLAVVRVQKRRVVVENRALRLQVRRLLRRKTYHPRRLHTSAGFSG